MDPRLIDQAMEEYRQSTPERRREMRRELDRAVQELYSFTRFETLSLMAVGVLVGLVMVVLVVAVAMGVN